MPMKFLDFLQLDGGLLIDEASSTFKDSAGPGKKRILELITDATHSGKRINNRVYPGKYVKDGAKTFFKTEGGSSFNKPFLKNHDPDLDPIGRIVDAKYYATLSGKRWEMDYMEPSMTGSGFIRTKSHISDEDAIEKFLDGRFATVSQAGFTTAAFCSTCTKHKGDLVPLFGKWVDKKNESHECNHYPGDMVDKEMTYLITGPLTYSELSQVNKPADDLGIHIGMKIIQDHLEDSESYFGVMGNRLKEIEIIKAPVRCNILDMDGNVVKSLTIQDYVPTKTISIPPSTPIENKDADEVKDNSVSNKDQAISALELADARVLSHFKTYFGLTLTEDESKKVEVLTSDKLTDAQKAEVKVGLYLTPFLPFSLTTQETLDACVKYADRIFTSPEQLKTYLTATEKQADSEKLIFNKGTQTMDEKQSKALLEALDAEKAKVKTLEDKVKALETERDTLKKGVIDSKVQEVISLRAQVGHADCAGFATKSVEDQKAITEKYGKMSDELLSHMLQEAKDSIAAGVVLAVKLADTKIESPLQPEKKVEDAVVVTPAAVQVKDSKAVITSKTSVI